MHNLLLSQQRLLNFSGHRIAVVDIGVITKKYNVFTQEFESMKNRGMKEDEMMKAERERARKMYDELKGLSPTSAEYSAKEAAIARLETEFKLKIQNHQEKLNGSRKPTLLQLLSANR